MKLLLDVRGLADAAAPTQHEIDIRNPAAIVSNLRAAISIRCRVESGSFRMSKGDTVLTDETAKLSALLKDGDTVTVTITSAKRDRPAEASAGGARPAAGPARAMRRTEATSVEAEESEDDYSDEDDDEEEFGSDESEAPDGRALGGILAAALGGGDDDDSGSYTGDDDSDDDDLGSDLSGASDDSEAHDEAQLIIGLNRLNASGDLRARWAADPRSVLAQIQSSDPELFQAIGRRRQYFLDMLQLDTLGWLDGAEDPSDEEGDHDDEVVDSAVPSGVPSPQRPVPTPPGADTRPPASNAAAEAALTARDREAIDNLAALGIADRAACEAAYRAAGRDANRAAAALFARQAGSS